MSSVDRHFAGGSRDSNLRIEIVGGITSFLTAACLLVVIASLPASSGMERAIPLGYTFLTMVGGKH